MASENDTTQTDGTQTDTAQTDTAPDPVAGPGSDESPASNAERGAHADLQPAEVPPAKKAARKRATRKTAATATAFDAEPSSHDAGATDAPDAGSAVTGATSASDTTDATDAPARPSRPAATKKATAAKKTVAKRAPRKKAATELPPPDDGADPADVSVAVTGVPLVDEDALRFDALTEPVVPLDGPAGVHDGPTAPGTDSAPVRSGQPPFAPIFQAPAPRRRRASSSPTTAPTSRRSDRSTDPGSAGPVELPTDLSVELGERLELESGTPDTVPSQSAADTHTDLAADSHTDMETEPEDAGAAGVEQTGSDSPRRRRRRGGKGRRGRSAGAASDEDEPATGIASTPDESPDSEQDAVADDSADDGAEAGSASRRRTRRRRRGAAGDDTDSGSAAAATPGVTTKVRESRRDEVTAVKGSTRLEAKKQRRREGREAGRRRTVITEAEFLARRESVERVMVVRHVGDRTQIGVLEDGVLVEHYISKETSVSMAGNIYLGRVQNVLPSMEAAFVDIGKGRNAVLYAGEVNWDAAGMEVGQPKRIENALSSGESVLVQVTKDPIGHKGARLTAQISLPGRYLVYVPNSSMTGISRKLPDTERTRLKKILKEVVPESAGVIVRTAAEGASEEELRADVGRLTATWDDITAKVEAASGSTKKGKSKAGSAPVLLHGEPDLTVRVIRDIFNEDFSSLVVAGEEAWQEVSDYVSSVAPDLAERITRWTSEEELFTRYRVDEQIAKAMDRKVWLPSGGSLVIDRTEAMTVVDVNTGKFIGSGGNLEETVTKNNIEAAEEIVRQLRLRDVGGIIVIDFIDMVLESNRDLVVRRLLECLGRDRTKHQVAEVTSLGLVQMTRKRVGSGLIEVFSETCEHCNGRGIVVHSDPVDKSGDGQDQGSFRDDAASSGSGSGRSATSRRSRSRAPEPVVPLKPAGPTPAQIAAAAHAAAMKTGAYADELLAHAGDTSLVTGDNVDADEPLDMLDPSESLAGSADEGAPEPDQPVDAVSPKEADDREEDAPQDSGDGLNESVRWDDPVQQQPAYESTSNPVTAPVVVAPVGRPRRRRGRVVAPAGPPRSAVGHEGGSDRPS